MVESSLVVMLLVLWFVDSHNSLFNNKCPDLNNINMSIEHWVWEFEHGIWMTSGATLQASICKSKFMRMMKMMGDDEKRKSNTWYGSELNVWYRHLLLVQSSSIRFWAYYAPEHWTLNTPTIILLLWVRCALCIEHMSP